MSGIAASVLLIFSWSFVILVGGDLMENTRKIVLEISEQVVVSAVIGAAA